MSDNKDDLPLQETTRGEVPVRPPRGFGTLLVDADEVLVRVRARQTELARKKRAEFLRDSDDANR
ncbi:MAG TPA: hypothetical protein VGB24_14940 [Longimicrobium sp.]|jgi:hypothetical protein|uniref:hypothetical protein n=1 Tax=Longimicrobium sp. TaxID=2029185 RepID=UPI002ED7EB9D